MYSSDVFDLFAVAFICVIIDKVADIIESCVRALVSKYWYKQARPQTRIEVADIVTEIMREDNSKSSLLFDPDFACLVRIRVRSFEPAYGNKTPGCTCRIKKVNGEVKHIDDQYAFSPEPVFDFHQSLFTFHQRQHLLRIEGP